MTFLEKKIPPPIVAVLFGILMKLLSCCGLSIDIPTAVKLWVCAGLIILGLIVDVSALLSFRKVKTTINPLNPSAATELVVQGVYKISRNPMYLGLVLFLTAWGIYLSSLYSLMVIPAFIYYITYFQIFPEERALEEIFKGNFLHYKSSVSRWIKISC